ncbi:MAG: hypothetical protein ACRDHL_05600 [Candidatus Promineifilaceae bacterium]
MDRRTIVVAAIALLAGWAIGLFLFGWGLTPIRYTGAGPQHLLERDQQTYLTALADLYAFDNNAARVQQALASWPEAPAAICAQSVATADPAAAARLNALAAALNGVGCASVGAPGQTPVTGEGGNFLLIACLLGLLVLILVVIFAALRRPGGLPSLGMGRPAGPPTPGYAEPSLDMPEAGAAGLGAGSAPVTPLARFQTSYVRGHDTYDESFSIENAAGDFLGECGVGLSESIGADTPKSVTAFEVWLFDKNDIRTVTKVVMSDHAFFDEAIKAKLAPKGEPVLARPNETIVLETASLIVNAEITEMEYGAGSLPPQSFFERFTVELSAWAKDGEVAEPDVQGRIDEMLDF